MKKIITTTIAFFGMLGIVTSANAELSTAAFNAAQKKCDVPYGVNDPACWNKNGFDGVKEVTIQQAAPKNDIKKFILKLLDGREIEFKRPPKYKAYTSMYYMGFESNSIHKLHLDDDQGEDAKTAEVCVSAKDGKILKCK